MSPYRVGRVVLPVVATLLSAPAAWCVETAGSVPPASPVAAPSPPAALSSVGTVTEASRGAPVAAAASPSSSAPMALDPTLTPCPGGPTLLPRSTPICSQAPYAAPMLRVGRISLEAVMGLGLGAAAEVVGAYVGITIDSMNGQEAGVATDLGLGIGAALGVGSAVWLAGYIMRGDGSYGWAILGSTAGTLLAAILIGAASNTGTLAVGAALPVLGAIAGYELSSHGHRGTELSVGGVSLVPALAPTSAGVAARF